MSFTGINHGTDDENERHLKKAGPYILWNNIGGSPVKSVDNYLARRQGTDTFFITKILKNIQNNSEDGIHGKNLIHSEYTLLKMLEKEDGVVQQHGLFKDVARDDDGNLLSRLCLVLECYISHEFSPQYMKITNLEAYVNKTEIIPEEEALNIFYKIVLIIQRLHNKNIVHQDIKLSNIILNTGTSKITLANFGFGKLLAHKNDFLADQTVSSEYTSPERIEGKPYQGKPSDMWSLGVILFTMLYGQVPFHADETMELCIKNCEYVVPSWTNVSCSSALLVQNLLVKDPNVRLNCDEVLEAITAYYPYILDHSTKTNDADTPLKPQIVPGAVGYPTPYLANKEIDGVVKLENIVETAYVCIPALYIKADPSVLTLKDLHRLYKPYASSNRNAGQKFRRKN